MKTNKTLIEGTGSNRQENFSSEANFVTYSRIEFYTYLRTTLIPDLLEEGRLATACDFEAACRFLTGDKAVSIPLLDDKAQGFCNHWKHKA